MDNLNYNDTKPKIQKKMLSKWCGVTSFDGIDDLYESRNNKKHFVFWALVMITMFSCSIWFTYRTIIGYIETPSVTNVETVSESPLDMPDVMLCFNGGLNTAKLKMNNLSDDLIQTLLVSLLKGDPVNSSLIPDSSKEFKEYLAKNQVDVKAFISKFAFGLQEIFDIGSCTRTPNQLNCTNPVPILTSSGKCFIFKENFQQKIPSTNRGIFMRLIQPEGSFAEMYPEAAEEYQSSIDFSISMEKKLGEQQSARSLLIPSNSRAKISLNTKLYKRAGLTKPCLDGVESDTSNTCFYKCFNTNFIQHIGCVPMMYMIDQTTDEICDPFVSVAAKMNRTWIGNCLKTCYSKCVEWVFDATMSTTSLHANGSHAIVMIGYETMQYIKFEEVAAFTIDMAIANVGGQSGLWLGMSVITIIQGIYYLVLSMCSAAKQSIVTKK